MQFLIEYGLFFAKAVTIVAALLIVIASIVALSARRQKTDQQHLEITPLNAQYDEMQQTLSAAVLSPQEFKAQMKARKKADKVKNKLAKKQAAADKKANDGDSNSDGNDNEKPNAPQKRIFVLDFDGDIRATAVASLRHEISAILTIAGGGDEVVVRLESAGGAVHGYGLAASQLQRIREKKIPLTVSVDKVAASGGYLMACVADTIIAAPFAVLGSIGVIMQAPNLHRLLKKHEIDFEQLTAGEYKRTLTLFGENTDKARKKMQQELEETHDLFKHHVKTQRPQLEMDKVATGEHWLGSRALELGLVDRLQTSDDYLMAARADARLIHLHYSEKKKLLDKLTSMLRLNSRARVDEMERPLLM